MRNNDFAESLLALVNSLELPIRGRLDYLSESEDLVIYALPGGQVITEDMAGTQTVELPFEIAIKMTSQDKANAILWQINTALSQFDLDIPSQNGSYQFLNLAVVPPSLNELDEQGFYVYLLDLTACLEIERNE
ncbi:minor capsid protein [Streptococcus suis]|uniref:minor capsid protein n=1 Tax=Streptococcus suis TaxID=1307 RepID=UPI002AA4EFEC|nr:minor capsid protein [Streptococcus suis]HEM3717003.1 minor capsid protein [Streptococcus suis]